MRGKKNEKKNLIEKEKRENKKIIYRKEFHSTNNQLVHGFEKKKYS